MAQWLKTLVVLAEKSTLAPSTHSKHLTSAYNSSFRATDALFWPPQALHSSVCIQTQKRETSPL